LVPASAALAAEPANPAKESQTYANLYDSVQGETNASAAYKAYAAQALKEGYSIIANLFLATADAEAKHAEDEWGILQNMGATERPVAKKPVVRTTAQNLKAAFDGETYEYTEMYPGFLADARQEGFTEAARIFNFAQKAERIHAGNYADVLENLRNSSYIKDTYQEVYRCPICGEVVTQRPTSCPICGAAGDTFVAYPAPDNLRNPCIRSHGKGQPDCNRGCRITPPRGKNSVSKDFGHSCSHSCKQATGTACQSVSCSY